MTPAAADGVRGRVLVHMGKGGVGKTTTSAATAVRLAAAGRRTLVVSSDPAHSLADVFGHPLGDRPTAVADRLDAQQLSSRARLDAGWEHIAGYLQSRCDPTGSPARPLD